MEQPLSSTIAPTIEQKYDASIFAEIDISTEDGDAQHILFLKSNSRNRVALLTDGNRLIEFEQTGGGSISWVEDFCIVSGMPYFLIGKEGSPVLSIHDTNGERTFIEDTLPNGLKERVYGIIRNAIELTTSPHVVLVSPLSLSYMQTFGPM